MSAEEVKNRGGGEKMNYFEMENTWLAEEKTK